MKEIGSGKNIVIATRAEMREDQSRFREDLMAIVPDRTISESEKDIAEHNFRKPIHIAGDIFVRPFWRDGKEAPPLPLFKGAYTYRGHW